MPAAVEFRLGFSEVCGGLPGIILTHCSTRIDLQIDNDVIAAYFRLHQGLTRQEYERTQRQSVPTQGRWGFESTCRTCAGARVSSRHLFRSARPGAGQIRDVTSGPDRWRLEGRRSGAVRGLTTNLLSGRSRLCPAGLERSAATAARPQRGAQTRCPDHGLHRGVPRRARSRRGAASGAGDSYRVRLEGSPAQHRTCPGAEKKRQPTVD